MTIEDKQTTKKQRGNPAKLKSLKDRPIEERRKIASLGGIASGKAKKEKVLMSQIYADFLEEEFDIPAEGGGTKKMSTKKMINMMMKKVVSRSDGTSVAMVKEIREATEGSKQSIDISSTEEAKNEIQNLFKVKLADAKPE